jgi:phosphoserine phosphatase RsbU/P
VYGVLTVKTGEFTYANAGHNPPIWLCGATRKMELLRRTGAALGIIDEYLLEDCTITIDPDDFLLLYTDGMTEAFSAEDETYGDERLQQVLGAAEAATARGLLDILEASVRQFMGPIPPGDDLTLLGVKRMGQVGSQPLIMGKLQRSPDRH